MAQQDTNNNPFVGQWKPNLVKSRPKLDGALRRLTWVYQAEGKELTLKVLRDGKPASDAVERFLCDGQRHPFGHPVPAAPPMGAYSEGPRSGLSPPPVAQPSRNYVVCRFVSPNVIEGEQGDDLRNAGIHKPFFFGRVIYWTKEVSADGQQMATTTYEDKDRTKIQETFVLDRVN
jgi:hypothetical protein